MLSHWNCFLLNSAVKKTASSPQASSIFLCASSHQNILFYNTHTHTHILSGLGLLCVPHLQSLLNSQSLVSSDGSKEEWSHMLQLHLKLLGKSSPLAKKVALEMSTGDGNKRKGASLVAQQ